MADPTLESRVRQWLREHAGTAYCACIAARIKATAKATSLVVPAIEHRQPFFPGRCQCGRVGVRYTERGPSVPSHAPPPGAPVAGPTLKGHRRVARRSLG